MLVEINLLPQKEPKKLGFIISLSSILLVMLLAGGYYLWQINATKSDVASLDRQIAMTKKIAEKEEQNSQTVESTNSVNQLKSAIEWANEYPIQTIPIMRQLTSLLPERGFIQSFGYTEEGTITLSVQFDSAREAAYFLKSLNESKWVEDVSLSSLSAAATAESTAADTSNSANNQANTSGSTAGTTNQTNTTDQNQSATSQDTTGAAANAGTQTNTAAGNTVNQNTAGNTTTDTNTANNTSNSTSTSSTLTSKNKSDMILPRYTGQFEIKLDKEFVKNNIKKSKKDEKGVAGS